MEEEDLTQFYEYIKDHHSIHKFVNIVTKNEEMRNQQQLSFEDYKKKLHQECLSQLESFEYKIKQLKSKCYIQIITKPSYIPHSISMIYHQIRYLEDYINNYAATIDHIIEKCIKSIINLYTSESLIPKSFILTLETEKFKHYLERKKKRLIALKKYHAELADKLRKKCAIKITQDNALQAIEQILQVVHPSFDPSLAFFCPHPIQDQFESLLFHPDVFCADQVTKILTQFSKISPTDFVFSIVKLVENIGKMLEKNDSYTLSALIGLCFRAFFDKVYPEIKLFSVPELSFDLILTLRDYTVGDIDPPRKCCPKMKDTDKIRDIFKNDVHYSLAVEQAEFVSFFTNPLDILHHMYHSLAEIEKAAHIYGGNDSSMMSFDVTFGLTLCVLLSCDLPELMRIAMFTDQFTPEIGLCPDFEFARAKLSTASVHLQNKAQMKLSELANQKQDINK